jgi:hypothetical protein
MIEQLPQSIDIGGKISSQFGMEKREKPWRLRIAYSCDFNYLERPN